MSLSHIGCLTVLVLVTPLAGCSTPRKNADALEKLDGIARDSLDKTGVPGMAIAVVRDDEIVYAKGFGVREVGRDAKVDADTVFQLASLSKPIGASAIAGIVGDGTVKWTDPITRYLPGFALSDAAVTSSVTLEDMYSHRSGLPGGAGDILEILGFDRGEILRRLRYLPLTPPRSVFAYANFGMTAGGEAAAAAAGTSWEDLTRTRLFEPLGMTSTSSRYSDFTATTNRATIHKKLDGVWTRSPYPRDPDAQSPAGGVTSTVNDLGKWMRMMLASGVYDGKKVIDPAALRDMFEKRIEDTSGAEGSGSATYYGLGIFTTTDPAGRVRLSHSGIFDAGASTTCVLVPAEHLGIVVLTNGEPVGLPEAVAASFLDEVLVGSQTEDWLAHYHELFAAKPIPPMADQRRSPPAAARRDAAYVGRYSNDYYGPAVVSPTASGLALQLGPRHVTLPLSRWDGDTLVMEHVLEFTMAGDKSLVHFDIGADSQATSVTIDLLNGNGLGTFTR